MPVVDLAAPPDAPAPFRLSLKTGARVEIRVAEGAAPPRVYRLARLDQPSTLDLFEALADDFGLRRPHAREAPPSAAGPPLTPLLTEPVSPRILYGYGDPCVVRLGRADYRLLVTSNDAPDAFPILSSTDLMTWRLSGFVFPRGAAPDWCLTGAGVSDFWAPELHRVGGEWLVCFTARQKDRSLAVGIARAASPDGPFVGDEAPLVTGGVIDPHILVDAEGDPWLIWKRDDNAVWPRLLAELLHRNAALADLLFDAESDRRTAAFVLTLWPWISELEPMTLFFLLQPLIEAAAADLSAFERRLTDPTVIRDAADRDLVRIMIEALRTRIYAQRLDVEARRLIGGPTVILQNDLPWEGHLVEGVWITHDAGLYHLIYAGNDFSTARYGLGAAVAASPAGPYRKLSEVFIASTGDWWGPGHPSIAEGPEGSPRLFLHAFRPGDAAYKSFRALLSAPVSFEQGQIVLQR